MIRWRPPERPPWGEVASAGSTTGKATPTSSTASQPAARCQAPEAPSASAPDSASPLGASRGLVHKKGAPTGERRRKSLLAKRCLSGGCKGRRAAQPPLSTPTIGKPKLPHRGLEKDKEKALAATQPRANADPKRARHRRRCPSAASSDGRGMKRTPMAQSSTTSQTKVSASDVN